MDTTHDGAENDEVSSEWEDSLLAETPPITKLRYLIFPNQDIYPISAQYFKLSNERNALIQKIQARNEQLLMKEEEKLDENTKLTCFSKV